MCHTCEQEGTAHRILRGRDAHNNTLAALRCRNSSREWSCATDYILQTKVQAGWRQQELGKSTAVTEQQTTDRDSGCMGTLGRGLDTESWDGLERKLKDLLVPAMARDPFH